MVVNKKISNKTQCVE